MSDLYPRDENPTGVGSPGLHVCGSCSSDLVQLIEHRDAGNGHWHLELRCPECWTATSATVPDSRCAELDEQLEHGTCVLLESLASVQRELMAGEIDAFAAALRADLLLPEDF